MRLRITLAAAGILLGLYGVFRLVTQIPISSLIVLAGWLIGALVVHDGVLSPAVVGVGALLTRVPRRARRYLQAALIAGALITIIALPLIYRRGSQPRAKALELRPYGTNLALLLGLVAAASLALYAIRVARDLSARRGVTSGSRASDTNGRPSEAQNSDTE